jgi:hypothetical protein
LGQQVRNVGLAKDLDAILNALVGQMINQVLGPGGLLGASKRPSGGGQSAVDRGLYATSENSLYENTAAQKLPDGVLPEGQTEAQFCYNFKNNLYFQNTDDTPNTIHFQLGTADAGGTIIHNPNKEQAFKPDNVTPWTIETYNSVAIFCNNIDLTAPIKDATGEFNEDVKDGTSGDTPYVPVQETEQSRVINTADVSSNQSYAQYDDNTSSFRTAGNALLAGQSGGGWSAASTYNGISPHWMSFTFPSNQTFGVIEMSGYPGYSESLGPLNRARGALVSIADGESDPAPFKHYITADEASKLNQGQSIKINVSPSKNGNIVRIDNDNFYIFFIGIKFLRPSVSAPTGPAILPDLPITFWTSATAAPARIPANGTYNLNRAGSMTSQPIMVASGNGFINGTIAFSAFKSDAGADGPYDQKLTDVKSLLANAAVKFCPDKGALNCADTVSDFSAITLSQNKDSFSHIIPSVPQSENSKIRYKFTIADNALSGNYKLSATMAGYSGALLEIYITIQ